jgi:hypothetical protein
VATLHNPPFGDDDKALDGVSALRDLQADRPVRPQGFDPVHQRPSIGPISPNVSQPRNLVLDPLQESLCAVSVLDTGGRHHHREEQPERVDQDMALASLDVLVRIIPTESPFSVVLID